MNNGSKDGAERRSPLPVEALSWTCEDFAECRGESGESGDRRIFGQDRAIEAMRLGMEIDGPGYHIFVSGLTGTGREKTVKAMIQDLQRSCKPVPDRAYVRNFENPYRPLLLEFPIGQGKRFKQDVDLFATNLLRLLPITLGSQALEERRQAMAAGFQSHLKDLQGRVLGEAKEAGLALVQYEEQGEADLFPILDDKPVPPEQLRNLVAEGKFEADKAESLLEKRSELLSKLNAAKREIHELGLEQAEELRSLNHEAATMLLERLLQPMRKHWSAPKQQAWIGALEQFLLDNLGAVIQLLAQSAAEGEDAEPKLQSLEVLLLPRASSTEGRGENQLCPVFFESNPSFENLFGSVFPSVPGQAGGLEQIHSGSILEADGGYLILKLSDVLAQPIVWPTLKRSLRAEKVEIRSPEHAMGEGTSPLLPQAIPIQVKVVLIGEPGTYDLLASEDPEFRKIFKVHAQFETRMERNPGNLAKYEDFARALASEEGLLPPDGSALGRLAEFGCRITENRNFLSTRFGHLADLYREAEYFARQRGQREAVARQDLLKAERAGRVRHSLPQDYYLRTVRDGLTKLTLDGDCIGQLNGLVVLDNGTFVYGRPSRISARVGIGQDGVIDIERESELSGPIHEKGMQILSGYLLGTFARSVPLCLNASICFEQSYSGVDGDSASSTELYALLSALAEVPLAQGIAVTGAIDQFGRVQAVGGVNHKIEGFFDVCAAQGLTGSQGVVLPASNQNDLMLAPRVLEAVDAGRFRIFAVEDIRDGLEILTGQAAGGPDEPGTVLHRAAERLHSFAETWKSYRS